VAAPLHTLAQRNISLEVLRGMGQDSPRSLDLVARLLPKFLHPLGRDFAGTKGSRIYNALAAGELTYRSYSLMKPDASHARDLDQKRMPKVTSTA